MLAGAQRSDYLRGVQVMASRNYDGVDGRIVENFLLVRGAGAEAKFFRGVMRVGTTCRASHNHFSSSSSSDRRQQRAGSEASRTEKADPNGLAVCDRAMGRRQVYAVTIVSRLRIGDQHSEKPLIRFPGDQFVSGVRPRDGETMGDQRTQIQLSVFRLMCEFLTG